MSEIRISLDEVDFRKLARGEIVNRDGVSICLKDIGFVEMKNIVDRAAETTSWEKRSVADRRDGDRRTEGHG